MSSLVGDYGSDESDGEGAARPVAPMVPVPLEMTKSLARTVDAAPLVVGASTANRGALARKFATSENGAIVLKRNLPAAAVKAPLQGPEHPFRRGLHEASLESGAVHSGGSIERASVENWCFDEQFHTFQSFGYAMSAAGGGDEAMVGTKEGLEVMVSHEGESMSSRGRAKRPRKDGKKMDVGDEDEHSVWAPLPEETEEAEEGAEVAEGAEGAAEGANESMTDERRAEIADAMMSDRKRNYRGYDQNEDFDRRDERKVSYLLPKRHNRDTVAMEPESVFHGEKQHDYQGRSWVRPPQGAASRLDDDHDCFIPKKCVHRFTGHSKGVQTIRLFPKHGHLLLSASMDGSCKIWDVYGERRCKRTYLGHSEAARDINFNHDGLTFASTGFDRFVRVWDTETGACKHTLTPNRKMAYCVKFYPRDENILLAGASDNRIYQWDLRSGQVVQEYNHHLQPVNSVTFVDDDKRFVSTSDDKKIFIWEYNIPVPMKYISEPHMNSIPVVEVHPSGQFWCGQSLDNKIITYQATEKMKELRKKTYKGHLCAGFACGLTFSPNGRFLASGDGEGRVFFWDFKTCRVFRKMHAHDQGPCIGLAWHPVEPSWLFTCGWDGLIKLWD